MYTGQMSNGTWTPVARLTGTATGITYNQQLGNYQKVGNLVDVYGFFDLAGLGGNTGNLTCNLPFLPAGTRGYGVTIYGGGTTGITDPHYYCVQLNGASGIDNCVGFYFGDDTAATLTAIADTKLINGSTFSFTLSYVSTT